MSNAVVTEFSEESFTCWSVTGEEHGGNALCCNFVEDHCCVSNIGHHEDGVTACVSDLGDFRSDACCGFCISNLLAQCSVPGILDCISESGAVVVGHVDDCWVGSAHCFHHCSSSWSLDCIGWNDTEEVRVRRCVAETWVGGSVGNHWDSSSGKHCVSSHGCARACSAADCDNARVNEGLCCSCSSGTVTAGVNFDELVLVAHCAVCSVEVNDCLLCSVLESSSILCKRTGQWIHESEFDDSLWSCDTVCNSPVGVACVLAVGCIGCGVGADIVSCAANVAACEEGVKATCAFVCSSNSTDGCIHVS